MNIKKIGEVLFFNFICAAGATIALMGIILSCWLFFVSEYSGRNYFGGFALLVSYIGYLIYKHAFSKVNKKWGDHY